MLLDEDQKDVKKREVRCEQDVACHKYHQTLACLCGFYSCCASKKLTSVRLEE